MSRTIQLEEGIDVIVEKLYADLPAGPDAIHVVGLNIHRSDDLPSVLRRLDGIATHMDTFVLARVGILFSEAVLRRTVDTATATPPKPAVRLDVWLQRGLYVPDVPVPLLQDRSLLENAARETAVYALGARQLLDEFFHRFLSRGSRRPQALP